jgi:hypothetical protein
MTETRGFLCPVTGEPFARPGCLRRHLPERLLPKYCEEWSFDEWRQSEREFIDLLPPDQRHSFLFRNPNPIIVRRREAKLREEAHKLYAEERRTGKMHEF